MKSIFKVIFLVLIASPLLGGEVQSGVLEKDIANARLLETVIFQKKALAKDLLTDFGFISVYPRQPKYPEDFMNHENFAKHDDDMGFGGGRRIYFDLSYGSFTRSWVKALVRDGVVIKLEAEWECKSENFWKVLKEEMKKIWTGELKETGTDGDRCLHLEFEDQKVLDVFYGSLEKELGPISKSKVPSELSGSYNLLTLPLNFLTVAYGCGNAEKKPVELTAIEELFKLPRIDLIQNVLRGPNPEGRVYAAQALLKLEEMGRKLTKEDKEIIQKISNSKIPIHVCSGCIGSDEVASDVLGSSLYFSSLQVKDEKRLSK